MYRSVVDAAPQELSFAFDPLRPLHAHDGSSLAWPEYPYKQVVIDKLCAKFSKPRLSQEASAGALLIGRGDFSRAVFEVDQHFDHDHIRVEDDAIDGNIGWKALEERFRTERLAFIKAKQDFLKSEKLKVAANVQAIVQKEKAEQERIAYEAWKSRQIIKWYDNGSKYDGEGVNEHGVSIPHGQGTLWVPQKDSMTGNAAGDIKRVPRYTGQWMDGFMHGKGTYYWHNGDTWEGVFCRDELQGKGVFTRGSGEDADDNGDDTSRLSKPKEQRVRFYDASQHVCWGEELVRGCRLRVFDNRLYGDPLVSVVRRHNVDLEEETECVIVNYDEKRDQYQVRKGETEKTKWISLTNTSFRVVASRPIARFEPGE